jgi:hypothetical protein
MLAFRDRYSSVHKRFTGRVPPSPNNALLPDDGLGDNPDIKLPGQFFRDITGAVGHDGDRSGLHLLCVKEDYNPHHTAYSLAAGLPE